MVDRKKFYQDICKYHRLFWEEMKAEYKAIADGSGRNTEHYENFCDVNYFVTWLDNIKLRLEGQVQSK